ncbi:antileukoproteinase-like protein [Cricetulus griseus]|nr:antileukoproteinase-like protein [Cricetulus griseus]
MKSSRFFPFMVLLALEILASQTAEGGNYHATKPGACPSVKPGNCLRIENPLCYTDWACHGNKRCCQVQCSFKCVDPLPIHNPVRPKPGKCPNIPRRCFLVNPPNWCKTDVECAGYSKCCLGLCGRVCLPPQSVRTKPGKCPELKMECVMLSPFSTCERDGECEHDYKCCQSVCGKLCFPPQKGIPDTGGPFTGSELGRIQHRVCLGPSNSPASTHEKRTDIRVLELFVSTKSEPWSHTFQERKRLLLHPPEERMGRRQYKSTFNNRKNQYDTTRD